MSALLLDTHAFIWLSDDSPELPTSLRVKIEATDSVFVSIASFWEISIKAAIGKLSLKDDFSTIEERFRATRFILLPISIKDTVRLQTLPNHHKDPFDRIIIAQALTNSLSVVSRDNTFNAYPIQCVWDINR
ncbi:MAG: type II toxin-antitoxin system VapC family toxin [Phormidesmis sp.]